jgi:AcrR family transcriptional regulator
MAKATSGIEKRRATARRDGSRHYQARREELIQAAAAAFRDKGLARTSLDDVAKAAGVDRASLYYYVGNKQELFDEVVMEALIANVEMAEAIRDGDGAPDVKLAELLQRLISSYGQFYPHLYVFLQEDASHFDSGGRRGAGGVAELYRRFELAMIAIIQQGVDEGKFRSDVPVRIAAYGIMGMANWTHRWFNPDGPVGADEVGRAFAVMATDGLRAR